MLFIRYTSMVNPRYIFWFRRIGVGVLNTFATYSRVEWIAIHLVKLLGFHNNIFMDSFVWWPNISLRHIMLRWLDVSYFDKWNFEMQWGRVQPVRGLRVLVACVYKHGGHPSRWGVRCPKQPPLLSEMHLSSQAIIRFSTLH